MKAIMLDGSLMIDRSTIHQYIKDQLEFDDNYGRNLDALYDLLSTFSTPLIINITNADLIRNNLGTYGEALITTFIDAGKENSKLSLKII